LRLLSPTIPLPIPALDGHTRAPWPVWRGSIANPVRFVAMPKKAAVRLWHRARDFDRNTHQPGRHGGAVGSAAMQVLTGVHLMRMAARANRFRQPLALPERERATGCHRV
jgi:hypothetical protein